MRGSFLDSLAKCLFLVTLLAWQPHVASAQICFMLYQIADTDNIEQGLVTDLEELIRSPGIQDTTFTTWVYHDARNLDGSDQDWPFSINGVWSADGSMLLNNTRTKFEGSRYFTYDHNLGKMVLDTELEGEQNSDDPQVMVDFFTHAMTDCVANGSQELFVVFSSHGTGYAGYGGDSHVGRRRLVQPNYSIVRALQTVLENVNGAPDVYDVIGFDACLMSALDALDDYAPITKYYLASEAVEPGHGWNYEVMSATTSAVDLAIEFVNTFANTPQGEEHDTPKTLAVIDSAKYMAFKEAFDALILEFSAILESDDDATFFAHLNRARAASLAYDGYLDMPGDASSELDIGSFLKNFESFCQPNPERTLAAALTLARATYDDQFVEFMVGPGTSPESTGMGIVWPPRSEYFKYKSFWEAEVADLANATVYTMPSFLMLYFTSNVPDTANGGNCLRNGVSNIEPQYEGQLLLSPSFTETLDEVYAQSELTVSALSVLLTYGLDISKFVFEDEEGGVNGTRRELENERSDNFRDALLSFPERFQRKAASTSRLQRQLSALGETSFRRRAQSDEDYFYLMGGDAPGIYCSPTYTGVWDRFFYLLVDNTSEDSANETITPVYVQSVGQFKRIPVVVFKNYTEDMDLYLLSGAEAAEQYAGDLGFLTFSLDNETMEPMNNFALYVSYGGRLMDASGDSYTIAPVISVNVQINGTQIYELVGGFDGKSVMLWEPNHNISVEQYADTNWTAEIPGSQAIVSMVAVDEVGLLDYDEYYVGGESEYPPIGDLNCPDESTITSVTKTGVDMKGKDEEGPSPSNEVVEEPVMLSNAVFTGSTMMASFFVAVSATLLAL